MPAQGGQRISFPVPLSSNGRARQCTQPPRHRIHRAARRATTPLARRRHRRRQRHRRRRRRHLLGMGRRLGADLGAASKPSCPGLAGSPRGRLALRRRAGCAHHPQAGRGPLHRARRGGRVGAHRQPVGRAPHHRGGTRAGSRRRDSSSRSSSTASGVSRSRSSRERARALAMAINDLILWYAGAAPTFAIVYIVSAVVGRRRDRRRAVVAGGARPGTRGCPRPVRGRTRAPARSDVPTRDASSLGPASVEARGWGWRHGGRRSPARARPRPRHRAGRARAAARCLGVGQVDAAARARGRARRRGRGRDRRRAARRRACRPPRPAVVPASCCRIPTPR